MNSLSFVKFAVVIKIRIHMTRTIKAAIQGLSATKNIRHILANLRIFYLDEIYWTLYMIVLRLPSLTH